MHDLQNKSWDLYLNGALIKVSLMGRISGYTTQESIKVSLGRVGPELLHGEVAEFTLWDRALNREEIASMSANCRQYNDEALITWDRFDTRGSVQRRVPSHSCNAVLP